MDITIASTPIADPVEVVATYLRENEDAVRGYDLHEQESPDRITAHDVLATQHVESRVDSGNVQYFTDNGRDAPWHLVPPDAHLADADPAEEDGLYDRAEELYRHFHAGRRQGMTPAKIHKVLHLKRPHLYPLLDGRLRHLFEDQAQELSKRIREVRRGRRGRLYWGAIREDVVANRDGLAKVREELASREEPASLAAELSDVRLHDILAWDLVAHLRRGR